MPSKNEQRLRRIEAQINPPVSPINETELQATEYYNLNRRFDVPEVVRMEKYMALFMGDNELSPFANKLLHRAIPFVDTEKAMDNFTHMKDRQRPMPEIEATAFSVLRRIAEFVQKIVTDTGIALPAHYNKQFFLDRWDKVAVRIRDCDRLIGYMSATGQSIAGIN